MDSSDMEVKVTWSAIDETNLIKIWEKYETKLRENRGNYDIYKEICKELGNKFSPEQVHNKINSLIQRYRNYKQTHTNATKWNNFNYVHKIMISNRANEKLTFSPSSSNSLPLKPIQLPSPIQLIATPVKKSFFGKSSSSPLASSRPSVVKPKLKNEQSIDYRSEMLGNINKLTAQYDKQLAVLQNIAQGTKSLCTCLEQFVQQQNDRLLLEVD